MKGFLLDTNTVSELIALRPNQQVLDWIDAADESLLHLSVLTLGEIRHGVAALPQSKKRTRLESWLEVELKARFGSRLLPVDGEVADRWGWIMADTQTRGLTLPVVDALIAATAIHHDLALVTRNITILP